MTKTHGVTHYNPDGCFGCRVQTVTVAPSATPSRNGGMRALTANQSEKQWDKDMPRYKALREAGYNPKSITGVADLEARSESGLEIEMGKSFVDQARSTDSFKSGDVGAMRDVTRGAPEFRKRAIEAHEHLQKTAWTRTGPGKPEPLNP